MSVMIMSFLEDLKSLGNRERAIWDERYHKSKREHWGAPAPGSHKLYHLSKIKFSL